MSASGKVKGRSPYDEKRLLEQNKKIQDANNAPEDFPILVEKATFHYVGYNESGRRIDSTYVQGTPAKIRLGNNALVPGFEEGICDMRPGGKRRIIMPPKLGPPV